MFKAIVAMAENRTIGLQGKIPWHLPEDFKWFKKNTVGKAVLMGRKTFESFEKPLPNRTNVVLTRNPKLLTGNSSASAIYKDAKTGPAAVSALRAATSEASGEQLAFAATAPTSVVLWGDLNKLLREDRGRDIWVIGGANVYSQTLPYCSDLFVTHVKGKFEGDTFFPEFERDFAVLGTVFSTTDFEVVHYQPVSR